MAIRDTRVMDLNPSANAASAFQEKNCDKPKLINITDLEKGMFYKLFRIIAKNYQFFKVHDW